MSAQYPTIDDLMVWGMRPIATAGRTHDIGGLSLSSRSEVIPSNEYSTLAEGKNAAIRGLILGGCIYRHGSQDTEHPNEPEKETINNILEYIRDCEHLSDIHEGHLVTAGYSNYIGGAMLGIDLAPRRDETIAFMYRADEARDLRISAEGDLEEISTTSARNYGAQAEAAAEAMRELAHAFSDGGTITGRTSSPEPEIHNIPLTSKSLSRAAHARITATFLADVLNSLRRKMGVRDFNRLLEIQNTMNKDRMTAVKEFLVEHGCFERLNVLDIVIEPTDKTLNEAKKNPLRRNLKIRGGKSKD